MIRFCRVRIARFIEKHKESKVNDMILSEIIDENYSVNCEEFIEKYVLDENSKETPYIVLLTPLAFRIDLHIVIYNIKDQFFVFFHARI